LGFAISPHEECAVEEAIQQVEEHGGSATVLTMGAPEGDEQLRSALAMGATQAVLMPTDGEEMDPQATSQAILAAIHQLEQAEGPFDLILFGNEAADSGGYQVAIRVAHGLDRPCLTGIKALDLDGNQAKARREAGGGWENYRLDMPAVFSVKEGISLPRYPPLRGRMRAKKAEIPEISPEGTPGGLEMIRFETPPSAGSHVEILGEGPAAAGKIVDLLENLGLLSE
jgi:electron transfer flavoprotein beta subunit